MLLPLTPDLTGAFAAACAHERVFGSKAMTALRAYGLEDPDVQFFLCRQEDRPTAALYLSHGVLVISAEAGAETDSVAELIRREGVRETDTNYDQCAALQKRLGGVTESSYYMVYRGGPVEGDFSGMVPGDLPSVFDVLQRSHEYYRTHLDFQTWSADLTRKLDLGLVKLYQMEQNGRAVGTGSIASQDDECGVVAAVAVVPELRHQGLGAAISRFLTRCILDLGKMPRLISGYDGVAELYKQVGYETCGRWGELYL